MTPRERALILRLAAILETGEWGAQNLRRTLADLGWGDGEIDRTVARVWAALYRQAGMFERVA